MIGLVVLSCLAVAINAQYPYNQGGSGGYQSQQYQPNSGSNTGAPVHYVSIGPQLQGDYKFGYNTGNSGSFREETRLPDGSVQGAYGYIDASGQQKVIKYTAGKDGFKAEGDDIPKPPPPQQPVQPSHNAYPQQPQQSYAPNHNNNYNNYQPQPNWNQYNPQQYGGQQQQGYNPFAYVGAPGSQPPSNHLSQLSYNIGGGNQYQG